MAEQPDLDEQFSLYPMEGEEVLRHLMGEEPTVDEASDDDLEDEDS